MYRRLSRSHFNVRGAIGLRQSYCSTFVRVACRFVTCWLVAAAVAAQDADDGKHEDSNAARSRDLPQEADGYPSRQEMVRSAARRLQFGGLLADVRRFLHTNNLDAEDAEPPAFAEI